MWPVHTWLPFAHVEAPTAASMILAGVMLKMGGYGMIRITIQMLPQAGAYYMPVIFILSIIAIIYISLVALAQGDMKKLIAYSSIAHMGYVTPGIFAANTQGMDGAILAMLSHGFVAAGLFLGVGTVYDRLHTREIDRYGGLAGNMPGFAVMFMVCTLASIGLPGTSGFVGEFLSLQGVYLVSSWTAFLAATGIVLGAAYMLWLYRRVFYGPLTRDDVRAMTDLTAREYAMYVPLVVLVIWMGVYPATFRNVYAASVDQVVADYQAPLAHGGEAP
jgi:NADH-quinone oxidoreductase subunit M